MISLNVILMAPPRAGCGAVEAPPDVVKTDARPRKNHHAEGKAEDEIEVKLGKELIDGLAVQPAVPLDETRERQDEKEAGQPDEEQPVLDVGKLCAVEGSAA